MGAQESAKRIALRREVIREANEIAVLAEITGRGKAPLTNSGHWVRSCTQECDCHTGRGQCTPGEKIAVPLSLFRRLTGGDGGTIDTIYEEYPVARRDVDSRVSINVNPKPKERQEEEKGEMDSEEEEALMVKLADRLIGIFSERHEEKKEKKKKKDISCIAEGLKDLAGEEFERINAILSGDEPKE